MHTVSYARAWDKWVPRLIEDDTLSLVVCHLVKKCQARLPKQIFPSDLVNLIVKYCQLTKEERSCHDIDNEPAFKETNQFHWEDMEDQDYDVPSVAWHMYCSAIRVTLISVINCILPSSSMGHPEIINGLTHYPCVEMKKYNKGLLLNPVIISLDEYDQVLIEGSMNSVRISFKFRKWGRGGVTGWLSKSYCKMLMKRCELFDIIRRKPINENWDLTFLIMYWHLESGEQRLYDHDHPCFDRLRLVSYLIQFVKEFDDAFFGYLGTDFLWIRGKRMGRTWLKQF